MSRFLIFILLFSFSLPALSQNTAFPGAVSLTAGAKLLFKNVKTKIPDADKNFLFRQTGLSLAADKNSFVISDMPVETGVFPTDMNNDGKEEIFIVLNSAAVYGNVGSNFLLFIKNASGAYNLQKEASGGLPVIFASKNMGYNDLMIGGPGFLFPVYRWNGTKYIPYKKIKDEALSNTKSFEIEEFSAAYTSKM